MNIYVKFFDWTTIQIYFIRLLNTSIYNIYVKILKMIRIYN